ncbi:MAG TPA: GNAT family protein [Longimicrobium sp.]
MPTSLLCPAYRVVTSRVVLRCWEPADTAALHRVIAENLEHLRPWVSWIEDEPRSMEERLCIVRSMRAAFDADESWSYAVIDADDGELAGGFLLRRIETGNGGDLGGWVAAARGRRGYQSEAAAAMSRVCLEVMRMERVQAVTAVDNERSIALMRKLGFTQQATDGERQKHELLWSISADEWTTSYAAELAADARAYDAIGTRLF